MKHRKTVIAGMTFALFATGAVFVSGSFRIPVARAADCGITASDVGQIAAVETIRRSPLRRN